MIELCRPTQIAQTLQTRMLGNFQGLMGMSDGVLDYRISPIRNNVTRENPLRPGTLYCFFFPSDGFDAVEGSK